MSVVQAPVSHLVLLVAKVGHGLRLGHPGVPHHSVREPSLVHLKHSTTAAVADLQAGRRADSPQPCRQTGRQLLHVDT